MKPRALVLRGDGINCEWETAHALSLAHFEVHVRHIGDLLAEGFDSSQLRKQYRLLALPGGFSFGDDLSSGKVLALKIQFGLRWDLADFAQAGGLVIGICNGFQALVRLGVFGSNVSITHNVGGSFIDTWVSLRADAQARAHCPWLRGIEQIELPIRHGEGRLIYTGALADARVTLRYLKTPNGSQDDIAGLCDQTGRIFGLMPHPEAFVRWTQRPDWTLTPARATESGAGLDFFRNAAQSAALEAE